MNTSTGTSSAKLAAKERVEAMPGGPAGWRTAVRVVFPQPEDYDRLPLYIDGGARGEKATKFRADDVLSRRSVRVREASTMSFGSYINAFPAAYWQRWTNIKQVRLDVVTSGEAVIVVYRSNGRGAQQKVDNRIVSGDAESSFELPMGTFGDGGFYWFEIIAQDDEVILKSADWHVPDNGERRSRITIGITTFNRPDFCVRTIGMVANEPDIRNILDELIIIDQGTQKVCDDEGYAEVAEAMGSQLRIINQDNLGGSGGFSRCMYEAATADKSDSVMLHDDDILVEPEGILRAVTFSDYCRKRTIVGGHMFDINMPTVLQTAGEVVDPFYWLPGQANVDQVVRHDFKWSGLRDTEWLHQRIDPDYNAWWMCLIPVSLIKEIGLSLPLFLKWDDIEYGLRAKQHGVSTVTLPGSCVWHIAWGDKDDTVGWQAYYHARNRVLTALMYSPFDRATSMMKVTYYADLKHQVAMQYYTAVGRIMGIQDLLSGPEHMHPVLASRAAGIRAMAKDFSDARMSSDPDAFPEVQRRKPIRPTPPITGGGSEYLLNVVARGSWVIAKQLLKPVDPSAMEAPQMRVTHKENRWYHTSRNDSAVVSNAEGTAASWYKRDPKMLRKLVKDATKQYAEVYRRWPELRKQYLGARDQLTSFEAWEKTFGIEPAKRSGE